MKTPQSPQPLAVRNTEPMALATGSPRIPGCTTRLNTDRRAAPGASAHGSERSGFTLIEAMIAITMTLIIMLALAQGFKRLSDDISQGRARLALSDQLRSVSEVLRNDLASLTVDPDPTTPNNKLGYFMYYDGPVTDYTAATLPINTVANGTTEQRLSASKYGDFDDILMFTAKAKGDYFKGRVPLAIVKAAAAYQTAQANGTTPDYSTIDQVNDWNNSVVMASQFAEIVYFMMPALELAGPALPIDPATQIPLIEDRGTSVLPSARIAASNAGGTATIDLTPNNGAGDGIPDKFVLCRRVLLVIDELNILFNPSLGNVPTNRGLYYGSGLTPEHLAADAYSITGSQYPLPFGHASGFLTAMRNAYQRCDLSVRRVPTVVTAASPVASNSLSDLSNPANRFAHTMIPLGAVTDPNYSMPILSLTAPIASQVFAINNANAGQSSGSNVVSIASRTCGFMRPEFLRQRDIGLRDHDDNSTTPDVLVGDLDGSEFLAMNCIGFDLKGFDPSARLLYHPGPDDIAGTGAAATIGSSWTDDLVLSPSDPGYVSALIHPVTSGLTLAQLTASQGSFVDIGWAFKKREDANGAMPATRRVAFVTSLSGFDSPFNPQLSLLKSGRMRVSPTTPPYTASIFQPCFDSFTDTFENDGFAQPLTSGSIVGAYFENGLQWLQTGQANSPASPNADVSFDITTTTPNTDTSPPINFAMPAIQATIRLEDKQAGVIQQIAVTQSLVNP
jgi:type II secretory pathway component PulJ